MYLQPHILGSFFCIALQIHWSVLVGRRALWPRSITYTPANIHTTAHFVPLPFTTPRRQQIFFAVLALLCPHRPYNIVFTSESPVGPRVQEPALVPRRALVRGPVLAHGGLPSRPVVVVGSVPVPSLAPSVSVSLPLSLPTSVSVSVSVRECVKPAPTVAPSYPSGSRGAAARAGRRRAAHTRACMFLRA